MRSIGRPRSICAVLHGLGPVLTEHPTCIKGVWEQVILVQVLNAKEKVACGKLYNLDMEVSTGAGQKIKINNAEVSKALKNQYEVHSSKIL